MMMEISMPPFTKHGRFVFGRVDAGSVVDSVEDSFVVVTDVELIVDIIAKPSVGTFVTVVFIIAGFGVYVGILFDILSEAVESMAKVVDVDRVGTVAVPVIVIDTILVVGIVIVVGTVAVLDTVVDNVVVDTVVVVGIFVEFGAGVVVAAVVTICTVVVIVLGPVVVFGTGVVFGTVVTVCTLVLIVFGTGVVFGIGVVFASVVAVCTVVVIVLGTVVVVGTGVVVGNVVYVVDDVIGFAVVVVVVVVVFVDGDNTVVVILEKITLTVCDFLEDISTLSAHVISIWYLKSYCNILSVYI